MPFVRTRRAHRPAKPRIRAPIHPARVAEPVRRDPDLQARPTKRSLVALFAKDVKSELASQIRRVENATTDVVVVGSRRGGFQRRTRGPGGARFIPLAPDDGPHAAVNAAAKLAARQGFGRLVFMDLTEAPGPNAVPLLDRALSSSSTLDLIASVAIAADPHTSQYRPTSDATLDFVPMPNRMTNGNDVRMSTFIAGPRAIDALARANLAGKAAVGNELVALAAAHRLRMGEVSLRPAPTSASAPAPASPRGAAPNPWSTPAAARPARRDGLLSRIVELLLLRRPLLTVGFPGALAVCLGLYLAATVFLGVRAGGEFHAGSAWAAAALLFLGLVMLFFAMTVNLLVAIRNRLG